MSNKKSKKGVKLAIAIFLGLLVVAVCITVALMIKDNQKNQGTAQHTKAEQTAKPEEEKNIITLPNFKGKDQAEIEEDIENLGLYVAFEQKYSSEIEENYAMGQYPKPGTEVEEDARVVVVLSEGPETVTVPNVLGKKKADAVKQMKDLGFTVHLKQAHSSSVAKGNISAQSHKGDEVSVGTEITLTVSKGSKAKPKKKTSKKPTVVRKAAPQPTAKPKPVEKTEPKQETSKSDMALDDLEDVSPKSDFTMDDLDEVN